jgi:dynein heavy chain
LYFNIESKGIKITKTFESKVNFTANDELLIIPATLNEELAFVLYKKHQFREKVEAK